MPDLDDEQFDRYLKNFRPVEPGPLPFRVRTKTTNSRSRVAFAVTAVGCFAAAAVLLIAIRHPGPALTEPSASTNETKNGQTKISAPILTRTALDDQEAFAE